jgi:hypothetical protein
MNGVHITTTWDWLFIVLRPAQEFFTYTCKWIRHHYWWRAATFRHMLDAQGLWAGRDLYRATPAATWGLGFPGLIRRTAYPFSRLLRHTRGCWGPILTLTLTGTQREICWNNHEVLQFMFVFTGASYYMDYNVLFNVSYILVYLAI